MQYIFSSNLLVRSPVNKPENYTREPQLFLDDHHFLAAVYLASPTFYAVLEKLQFIAVNLSDKENITLKKYINRYCFRPTPFGLFASISLVKWGDLTEVDHHSASFSANVSASVPVQKTLGSYLLEHKLKDQARFESNPSLYRVLNEYRFFRSGLDESGKHREYQLQSIAFSKLLKDLIHKSFQSITWQEIVGQIAKSAGCNTEEAEDYADFLIDAQLMIYTERMSITGVDYLPRLIQKLQGGQHGGGYTSLFAGPGNDLNITAIHQIKQLENELQALFPEKEFPEDKLSVILKRNGPVETLAFDNQRKLRDGIAALELLSAPGTVSNMTQFINSYQQQFEGQTQPLLLALDPEAGIGYQHPETEKNNPLLETLHIPHRIHSNQNGNWSPAHSILLERWLKEKSPQVIRLTEPDLERLKTGEEFAPLLGMSVLFRLIDDKVFIENAGGINAPALMGRFTVADAEISKAANLMAQQLEFQNPDIIFAELLHLSDPHTDNINRRQHTYHYELPVTASSSLPAERQLALSDLYVMIIDRKVMLYSKQHQKFVIPRLTSAYNHSLNKLPLFRFLADLPYQYGRSNLTFDLRQMFPGMHFYPRVSYKDCVLTAATWILTDQQIMALREDDKAIEHFKKIIADIQLPRLFSLSAGDQELVFDGDKDSEIQFFIDCIRQKKEVTLKEVFAQTEVRQYNAYLLPDKPMVMPKPLMQKAHKTNHQRKYIPGSSWLYLKIYAPRLGLNRLLLQIAPLLGRHYAGYKISKWFFIRYDDHAPHIRLRLEINPGSINELLIAFKTKLEQRIQQHVIREFQIDVYSRELERYAAGGIDNTERFFWASSELTLQFLKPSKDKPKSSAYLFALYSTYAIITAFIKEVDEQLFFTINSFQQFLPEFSDGLVKVELDKKYRELATEIRALFLLADPGLLSGSVKSGVKFNTSLQVIYQQLKGQLPAHDYLRSIIHMHLNRIFTDESRKQEMVCYYFLHKYLLSVKGRNKQKS